MLVCLAPEIGEWLGLQGKDFGEELCQLTGVGKATGRRTENLVKVHSDEVAVFKSIELYERLIDGPDLALLINQNNAVEGRLQDGLHQVSESLDLFQFFVGDRLTCHRSQLPIKRFVLCTKALKML